jgi:hypothetical protein
VTRALSSVRSISFSDLLKSYTDNGVSYAFQLGSDFEKLRGEQVIGLKPPKTAVYRAENTFLNDGKYDDAAVSRLLEAYLFNPLIVRKYPTEAGEEVFVGDSGLLTLKEDGMAVYEASGRGIPISELVDGAEDGAYDMLNAARRLTQASNGLGGAARFTLRSIETANGVTTIVFGLEMNGVPLMDAGKFNYGVVEIKDGCVYSAAIRYLSLFAEEEAVTILPEKQAAAIAAGNQTELPFVLEKEDRKYRLARVFRDTEG